MAQAVRISQSSLDKEGFLCPICLQDLGNASSLSSHFETAHDSAHDSADVLDQVKGFFGKAKKFFAFDEVAIDSTQTDEKVREVDAGASISESRSSSGIAYSELEEQEPGKTRMLTEYFKGIRDAKIDRTVIECNKMVIRLSKLTGEDVPDDVHKRKVFEQTIVPWSDDSSVKHCSTCGKSFNITRRRHHCRLCGGIMCDKCSQFLPFSQARLMCNSVNSSELAVAQPAFLRRRGSNSSLNSMGSREAGLTLRTCSNCRKLLELHHSKQEQRHLRPTVVVLYEKLQTCQRESEKLTPKYIKMAFSLRSGETTYSLQGAAALRQQIAKIFNEMENVSKRILKHREDEDAEPAYATTKLHMNIRAYTISYIQDQSATLPSLPDEKQLTELINQKEEERKRKIQKQIKDAQESAKTESPMRRLPTMPSQPIRDKHANPVVSVGWQPGEVDTRKVQDDDPMIQQMNIIKGYLQQARLAQRGDEIEMLEENLRHLEDEYYKQ